MDVQRFRIYTDCADHAATPLATDLTILPVDRMMAERSAVTELPPSQRGKNASAEHPHTWLLLWLWWSAKRSGITAERFTDWAATVLDFDPVDAHGQVIVKDTPPEDVEHPELGPTQRAGATT